MKKFSVALLLGLFVLTGLQTALAQKTSITVRVDGIKQVGVPVYCLQTGELEYTNDLGEVYFYDGITDRTQYFAHHGAAWHACLDDCDGPNPAPNHWHCELPIQSLGIRVIRLTTVQVDVPLLLTD